MVERKPAEEILDNERDKGAREGRPRPKNAHGPFDGGEERDARERLTRYAAFRRWS
jgi:hypothetical protein